MTNFLEMIPLLLFFIAYKFVGIKGATFTIMVSSLITILIAVIMKKKLSALSIISSLILVICSSLALISDNPIFIKIKPTIVYCTFMVCFVFFGKNILKDMMQKFIKVEDHIWQTLALCWAFFFLLCAIINEIIWRNFSEALWVNFKVIVMPIFSVFFILAQALFLKQYYDKSGRNYE